MSRAPTHLCWGRVQGFDPLCLVSPPEKQKGSKQNNQEKGGKESEKRLVSAAFSETARRCRSKKPVLRFVRKEYHNALQEEIRGSPE